MNEKTEKEIVHMNNYLLKCKDRFSNFGVSYFNILMKKMIDSLEKNDDEFNTLKEKLKHVENYIYKCEAKIATMHLDYLRLLLSKTLAT